MNRIQFKVRLSMIRIMMTTNTALLCTIAMGYILSTAALATAQSLSPQTATVTDLNGNPSGVPATPGTPFLFKIPVLNITSNTLTNVVGVAVPLTDSLSIVTPVSDYGNVASQVTANGTDYRGELRTSATPQRRYDVKVGFKSDQGEQENSITIPGNSGFGNGSQLAAWPPANYGKLTTTITAPASATAKELFVSVVAADDKSDFIYGGSVYKNQRTGEIIHVSSVDANQKMLRVRRGQYGSITPSACEAGDILAFEGVSIPDSVEKGVVFKVPVQPIPGPVGEVKLNIDSIVHPRMGDLMITLEDGASTPVVVLAPLQGGLANGADITNVSFADTGTTTADSQSGRLAGGITYVPSEPLSTFADTEGSSVTAWSLRVSDISSPYLGYVKNGWSLDPLN